MAITVDGHWSTWGEWERCSVTCGGGSKYRNRTCTDPAPEFGGTNCTGNETSWITCNSMPCPSMY